MFATLAILLGLLAWGVARHRDRAWGVLFASLLGAGAGALLYPALMGLAMGYQAASGERPGHFWETLRDVGLFWALGPIRDTAPRGALIGMLAGLIAVLRPRAVRPSHHAEAQPS